jgi:hypothetical protein
VGARVQQRLCDLDDVRRERSMADRVLGHEPQQVRPREVVVAAVLEPLGDQFRVRGKERAEPAEVAVVDRCDGLGEHNARINGQAV